jgi:hypothetical protein
MNLLGFLQIFLNKAEYFSFLLIKKKRVGQLISRKPAKTRYKCTNAIIEHGQPGHTKRTHVPLN